MPRSASSVTEFGCALLLLSAACSATPSERAAHDQAAIVYANDDRKEVFEGNELERRLAASTVALVRRTALDESGVGATAPSLASRDELCDGERFAQQPSVAFCSGVLVEPSLILTAAHCAQALPLSEVGVVFGYFYNEPGSLALTPADVAFPTQVVAQRSRSAEADVDVAWLRLDRDVAAWPPIESIRSEPLADETPLVVVSASEGVPLKIDAGAAVRDARSAQSDYFVAESDTFHGSSGAGAFDTSGALVGILSRGKEDFSWTDAQCNVTVREPSSTAAERYSYAPQAVAALCSTPTNTNGPCFSTCAAPCADTRTFLKPSGGGCSMQPGRTGADAAAFLVGAALLTTSLRRKQRKAGAPKPA